ncbi:hypothetical protein AB1Y20_009865 [Prymnesium parvum]|uniref:Vacuolar protein 8 n=1 Tax=Prymnesium parvum TaxID=97485 RepID=A0AB34K5M3_PRYPA
MQEGGVGKLEASFLAPLLPMVTAKNPEIRREVICALANLAPAEYRGAVSRCKNMQGHSLLVDLFTYTQPTESVLRRRSAISGLANLCTHSPETHRILISEKLLPALLKLSHGMESLPLKQVTYCIHELCGNPECVGHLLEEGVITELLHLVRSPEVAVIRLAVQALVSLSSEPLATQPLTSGGALRISYDLLAAGSDKELRRQGARLVGNLSLDPQCKAQIASRAAARAPLLERMLEALCSPQSGEDVHLALALGSLSTEPELHVRLCAAGATASLYAALCLGEKQARTYAAWALSNLAYYQPLELLCIDERGPGLRANFRQLHRLDATAALIKTLRAAPDDRKLICKLQPVPSGGQLNLQTNDDVGDNELDLHKEYLELTLRNLKVVWAVEDEQLVHQAKAAAALRSQYIQLAQHFKLSRADVRSPCARTGLKLQGAIV